MAVPLLPTRGPCVSRGREVSKRLFDSYAFRATVCFPNGSPDVSFVEEFDLRAEGVEWRRTGAMKASKR